MYVDYCDWPVYVGFFFFNFFFEGRLPCWCYEVPLGNVCECMLVSVCVFLHAMKCVHLCVYVCTNSQVICRRVITLNAACIISSRDNRGNDAANTYETGFHA